MFHEIFERENHSVNLIAYNVPKSFSSSTSERIAHDQVYLGKILEPLGSDFPSCFKLVHLGKARSNAIRPLKIIYDSKEKAKLLLSGFHDAKRSGTVFLDSFNIVSDKTSLQRQILRLCHDELNKRLKNGESGLRIIYVNSIPKVGSSAEKTGELPITVKNLILSFIFQ